MLVIADFGLSKIMASSDDFAKTFCGTLLYAAPAVFPCFTDSGYGANVDIWLAGVIIFGCILGLPEAPAAPTSSDRRLQVAKMEKSISTWCKSLLDKVFDEGENGDQVMELLLHMIDPDPETRYSSNRCLEEGCRNGLFKKNANGDIVDEEVKDKPARGLSSSDADLALANAHSMISETSSPRPSSPLPEPNTNNATVIVECSRSESRGKLDEESTDRSSEDD